MNSTLLQTKTHRPTPRPDSVERRRLQQRFIAGLWTGNAFSRKLTLVAAPAGFGKTTLVLNCGLWQSDQSQPSPAIEDLASAWLSLDDSDNNPERFLRYVIAALRNALPAVGGTSLRLLDSGELTNDHEEVLAGLINDVAAADRPVILTLDDYHAIHHPGIERMVTFMLDHQPPNLHIIIASRSDPALPLARLRARGQLLEVRARDLRFNEEEAAAFLTTTMGLVLRPEWITALEQRTEGWVAGLQLAALSIQGRDDAQTFMQDFTGSQHFVVEYLVEEVLQRQPEPVQRFLLETSVLPRMCPPLCDAVTESTGSEQMLADLSRRNVFVIPLDGERYWFRYHHLFAEFLKSHLQRTRAHDVPLLHRRAAEWFHANGHPEEALHHAFAIPDHPLVIRLVVDNWRRVYHTGRLATAVKWLESLPNDLLQQSPALGVAYCWTLFVRGDHERIGSYLEAITQSFDRLAAAGEMPDGHPEYTIIAQQVTLLRAVVMRHHGDTVGAISEIERLLPTVASLRPTLGPVIADMGYTACYSQLGYSYAAANDPEQAAEYLSRVSPHARACGNFFALGHATMEWARILLRLGRVDEAERICRHELALAEQPAYADFPAFCLIQLALADVLRVKKSWNEAEALLREGLETARRSGHAYYLALGYLIAARLHHSQGRPDQAEEAVHQAEGIAASIRNRFLDDALAEVRRSLAGPGAAPARESRRGHGMIDPPTERELEVLRLICAGKSNQEIADELFLSLNTVKRHANNLYGKLGVTRRSQAILEARRLELV